MDVTFVSPHQQQWLVNSSSVSQHRALFQRQYTDDTKKKTPNNVRSVSWAGWVLAALSSQMRLWHLKKCLKLSRWHPKVHLEPTPSSTWRWNSLSLPYRRECPAKTFILIPFKISFIPNILHFMRYLFVQHLVCKGLNKLFSRRQKT